MGLGYSIGERVKLKVWEEVNRQTSVFGGKKKRTKF